MELKEAIEILSEYRTGSYEALKDIPKVYRAIDTVLTALDKQYNKGYQDGFKQAKFDCEMDKLQKEMTVSELAKIIKNDIELGEYCTDCRFYDYCHPQVNEALCSTIEDIIKIAKEKKEVE